MRRAIPILLPSLFCGCAADPRPVDKALVPRRSLDGGRAFAFANGCQIVPEAVRAIVKTASAPCQPHHGHIARLYASAACAPSSGCAPRAMSRRAFSMLILR